MYIYVCVLVFRVRFTCSRRPRVAATRPSSTTTGNIHNIYYRHIPYIYRHIGVILVVVVVVVVVVVMLVVVVLIEYLGEDFKTQMESH
jgi:hypothetical protein